MKCPFCLAESNIVINSRSTHKSYEHWRRRKCLVCLNIFTTYEHIDLSYIVVVKSDGRTERFKEAKLYSGIYSATISSKTPNRETKVSEIVNAVKIELLKLKQKEVSSEKIKSIVLITLSDRDIRAYWRFRAYSDKETILKKLQKEF